MPLGHQDATKHLNEKYGLTVMKVPVILKAWLSIND
jgi:hypothetical protein